MSYSPPEHDVVFNDEGQCAIWPSGRDLPAGWKETGVVGDRQSCLAFVERTWPDIRPRSLLRRSHESGRETR